MKWTMHTSQIEMYFFFFLVVLFTSVHSFALTVCFFSMCKYTFMHMKKQTLDLDRRHTTVLHKQTDRMFHAVKSALQRNNQFNQKLVLPSLYRHYIAWTLDSYCIRLFISVDLFKSHPNYIQ